MFYNLGEVGAELKYPFKAHEAYVVMKLLMV